MTIRFFDPKREFDFTSKFRLSLILSVVLPIVTLIGLMVFGINWGIDFSGGTEMQVKFSQAVEAEDIRSVLEELGFDKNQVQTYGQANNNEMLIRIERLSTLDNESALKMQSVLKTNLPELDQSNISVKFKEGMGDLVVVTLPAPKDTGDAALFAQALDAQEAKLAEVLDTKTGFKLRKTKSSREKNADTSNAILRDDPIDGKVSYTVQFMGVSDKISKALSGRFGEVEIRRVEFVDSQVSKQLRTDGVLALFYALLAILIYIAIRFDILFAPAAVVSLIQDTVVAMMVFVFGRVEFDLPSIAAMLAIVGYSINNTIVIYDRIRELVPKSKDNLDDEKLTELVNKAVNETLSRTINTTLTTLFASVALWIFAGGVMQSFALVLTVGITAGAFSSMYIAPAAYLYIKKHFGEREREYFTNAQRGPSREDKARGVV